MGKLKNGVLGKPTQSAGEVTFAPWKGISVFKNKIMTNTSNSEKQIFQKARFAFVQSITTMLSDPLVSPNFIRRFWERWATNTTTGVNAFNSENIPLQIAYDPITPIPFAGQFSLIKFAKGTLESLTAVPAPTYDELTGEVDVSWSKAVSGNGLVSDKVYFAVFYAITGMLYISESAIRDDESLTLSMPIGLTAGTGMPYFLFTFRGATGSEVTSNSVSDDVAQA